VEKPDDANDIRLREIIDSVLIAFSMYLLFRRSTQMVR